MIVTLSQRASPASRKNSAIRGSFFYIMTKIPYTKPFLLLQEQVEQLKSRGLKFTDEVKALHLLKNISYYRLSGYWHNHRSKKIITFVLSYLKQW
jgi:hypothetical protein